MSTINVFKLKNTYVFKQYLNDPALFKQLADYYNNYRFEIPLADLDKVQDLLQAAGYDVNIVTDLSDYTVTIGRFQKHKEILKNSVEVEELGDNKVFLLKDKEAVDMALQQGATKYEGELFG